MTEDSRTSDVARSLIDDSDGGSDTWPEPQPLPDAMPAVLPFEPSLLPGHLRAWIEDITERVQCPIDYPAVGAIVGLAAIVGRKVGLRPKRQDDWLVVPNLWGAVIGRPGVMKSPALSEVLKPLKRLEIESKEEYENALQNFATAKRVEELQQKEHDKEIAKVLRDGGDALAKAQELNAGEIEEPTRKRFLVNDTTVEKLGVLLNENPNGVLCFRDELVGLLTSLDREGQEGARAFYLEAWNGIDRFTYDRIGRGTIDIEACCISLIGGIQPGPLERYLRAAVNGGRGDDGLLQRFQLAVWPEIPGTWRNVDRWPDTAARDNAHSVYRQLDALDVEGLEVRRDGFDLGSIPFLRLDSDGQELFDQWRENLEGRLRSCDDHPAIEAHLAKYRSLVPSIALLIHLAELRTGNVVASAIERAIRWAVYLESHARRIYASAAQADIAAALALGQKILTRKLKDGFALRDVYRPGWAGLADRESAASAVHVLIDHDWLEAEKEATDGAPRTRHWINPKIYELPKKGTDKTDKSPP